MAFTAVVHNSHLTFNGKHYFRGSAESVYIGSYGEKRTPWLGQNYLEVQADIPAARLVVRSVTTATIDFTRSKAADVKLSLDVAGSYSGSVDTAYTDLKTGKLVLVKFEMRLGDVTTAVNNSPKVLENLRKYGSDARVANEIFVVMEATMAHEYTTSTNVTFSRDTGVLKASADGNFSSSGSTTLTLSAGTTYAYLLCKADWNVGKTRVEKFIDDQWSTG